MKPLKGIRHFLSRIKARLLYKDPIIKLREACIVKFGNSIKDFSDYEIKALNAWHEIIQRNMPDLQIVFDIGAHDGLTSEIYSLYSGQKVFAFEPLPDMVSQIQKRVKRNQLIEIQPIACGLNNYKTTIFRNSFTASSSLLKMKELTRTEFYQIGEDASVEIDVYKLDDWKNTHNLPQPNLILIDVQGLENDVIKGGVQTIKKTKYIWVEMNFCEFYEKSSSFDTVYKQLTDLGFMLIDCVDFVYSSQNGKLLYFDSIFKNKLLTT